MNVSAGFQYLGGQNHGFRFDFVHLHTTFQHFSLLGDVNGLPIGEEGLTFPPFG